MLPLIKKYSPKAIKDIQGQDSALKELNSFVANFRKSRKKAAVLHGPIGVGKSSSAYAVANEHGLEVLEMNASDFRNTEQIQLKAGNAVRQRSLFSKGKLILIDDVDGLSGDSDRGGVSAIMDIIEQSKFPIVLTAENIYIDKLRSLVKKCNSIKFEPLSYDSIFSVLRKICDNEGIKCDDRMLKALAYRSAGDARAAINDLQTLIDENNSISMESVDELYERNRRNTIIGALKVVLKTTDIKTSMRAFDNVDEDIDHQMLWLEENVPKEYTKAEDLAMAFDKISRADVFNRRIRRWQHYRFYVYINALLTGGISVSKGKKYGDFVEYAPTKKLLKIWMLSQKQARKKAIAEKIAPKLHLSSRAAVRDMMSHFRSIYRNNKKIRKLIAEEFDLNEDEIEWLER